MKINKIVNGSISCDMEVDFYIPMTIEFPENYDKYGISEMIYYRYISKENSMIEITINSQTMRITRFVAVSINDTFKQSNSHDVFFKDCTTIIGNPEIEKVHLDESNTITEYKEISFTYFGRKVLILFDEAVEHQIDMGGLMILLNSEMKVIGFIIASFSENDWLLFKESCQIG